MRNRSIWNLILGLGLLSLLTACGGGGDGGDDGTIGTGVVELTGTAAVGKPIANATVTVKDRTGKKHTTTTNEFGRYLIELKKDDGPYIIRVEDPGARPLYSAAAVDPSKNESNIVANVHQLSDVSCRNWFGARGRDVDGEFASDDEIKEPPQENQLAAIRNALRALLRVAYTQFDVNDTFDFDRTPFDADGKKFDHLLDNLTITITKDKITILLRDPDTGLQAIIIIGFDLSDDLAQSDTEPPSQPTGLATIPASTSGIVVVWNSSTDNVGVAGYNVYRDGNKIATTPYPVFSDTGLSTSTQYCYAVEAFDGANILGPKTDAVCATTLAVADATPPTTPQNVGATPAGTGTVALAWLPSPEDDVLGYDVYRGPSGAAVSKIATTVASGFTDLNLSAGTQYCYRLRAFDAALNRSDYTDEICATTQPDNPPSDTAPPTSSASPMGGAFSSAQIVTLNCVDTGGSGCGPIYYTVDGSTPTERSSVYVQALIVGTTTTLRFYAVDQAGNAETSIHAETYTIGSGNGDGDAPINTTTADFIDGGAQDTNATSVLLSVSATDNVGVVAHCVQDNSTGTEPAPEAACWTSVPPAASYVDAFAYAFDTSFVPGDTAHVFVRFKDAAGNVSGVTHDTIAIVAGADNTDPLNTTGAGFINSGATSTTSVSITLALSASDNVAVAGYFVSSGIGANFPAVEPAPDAPGWVGIAATASYSASVPFTVDGLPADGDTLTVHVWFKDSADNLSQVASDSIAYSVPPPGMPFTEDFESGPGVLWSADNGVWQFGTPTAGPPACQSGANCAGTVLDGTYPGDTDSRLVGPPVQLPTLSAGEELQLRFWQWFSYGAGVCDAGYVQILVQNPDGSWPTGWTTIGNSISDSSPWSPMSVDLTFYAGKKIKFAFFHTATTSTYPYNCSGSGFGWFVDDVQIVRQTPRFTGDFEAGWGDWSSDRGVWQVGAPAAGPTGCYAGSQCAGTVLDAAYPGDTDSRLVSPSISLPSTGTGEELQLRFWQWFSYGAGVCDAGLVQVSALDGATGNWSAWTTLGNSISDVSAWSPMNIDLTAYAGRRVRIAFYHTATTSTYPNNCSGSGYGWFVDNVRLIKGPPLFTGTFEAGWGDWYTDRGVWEVGAPGAGPTGCNGGTQCAGTVLGAAYPGDTDSRLISPTVTLPTVATGEELQLRFTHWFSYGAGVCDAGYVQVSTWDSVGSTWSAWTTIGNQIADASPWSPASVPITTYAGSKVRLAFFHTATTSTYPNNCSGSGYGWFVDDVVIVKQ